MRITVISNHSELKTLSGDLDTDLYQVKCFNTAEQAAVDIASGTQVLIIDDTVDISALNDIKNQLDNSLPYLICIDQGMELERLEQLYDLGLDDIIPMQHAERLLVKKLESLSKYLTRVAQLSIDYEFAYKTAMEAMAGSSELGQVMKFVEQSYGTDDCKSLASTLFSTTDALGLNCVLSIEIKGETLFFSSNEVVRPLEQQLLQAAKNEKRFHDLGVRTVLNYPHASLLIKNMPVDDANRYGRLKDALPVLLGSLDAKVSSLSAEKMIRAQTEELGSAFDVIKYSFMHLNQLMSEKIKSGNKTMSNVLHDLSFKLPGMGLEEDQEEYILEKVETVMDDSTDLLIAEREMTEIFDSIRGNLHHLVEKQNMLLALLISQKRKEETGTTAEAFVDNGVELF